MTAAEALPNIISEDGGAAPRCGRGGILLHFSNTPQGLGGFRGSGEAGRGEGGYSATFAQGWQWLPGRTRRWPRSGLLAHRPFARNLLAVLFAPPSVVWFFIFSSTNTRHFGRRETNLR
ncbi:hypothetical protein Vafri_12404 [Volvox africanus]|uniref:Uncharacterized protein n=1 Tax=Volvox africanus TaxID=51714 RepID=A0A8J4BEK3_9CHLO|nr:hypothetical protein Vafri_12404 [Volvox africanus]